MLKKEILKKKMDELNIENKEINAIKKHLEETIRSYAKMKRRLENYKN